MKKEVQTNYESLCYKSQNIWLRFELFLSNLTATCLNTKEWIAIFTCLTRVNGWYDKGADFVVTVA